MRNILGFVRTTLLGGLLYLVPIVVIVAVLGKAIGLAHKVSPPVFNVLERAGLGHILTPQVVATLLLVFFCFAAGLFARTKFAKRIANTLETKVLSYLPGYEFIKGLSEGIAGVESSGARAPVMARIEDAWQIAFIVDQMDDGHLAIFVPSVPDSRSGSLYFMTPDRVKPMRAPLKSVMQTLRRMGVGSNGLLGGRIE